MCTRDRRAKALMAVFGVLICAASALAGGGNVLPASANPKGYSLLDMAAATADYNTGGETVPDVPFQILVPDFTDYTVRPGTMLYVPIFFVDDSGGAPDGFPTDITDQDADADFLDSLVFDLFNVEAFIVQVDGKTTILDDDYVSGTTTAPLSDGSPAGTNYIVSAAFLTPLTPGNHTVSIGGMIDGQPVVFVSYDVTVR